MIIRKIDNIFIVRIFKDKLNDFDVFNQDSIRHLFKNVLSQIRSKYYLEGLLSIDIYVNECYGMIIEIEPINYYQDEIDMKIQVHLDCIFLYEINLPEIKTLKNVYYYKNKYYTIYQNMIDSNVIYKADDILEKGIKIT